mmetsp:Transcript_7944/g.18625  ORF Transcript_7944/g.18625 Transcript_7944/m.18625 type:complete len:248 (-) Transcript_7944:107-850(-)
MHGHLDRLAHRQHVHAVHLDARHVVAARVVVRVGRATLLGSAHAVLVVLANVDERQLPQRSHVHGLVELALVGRAVSVKCHRHAAVALVLVRKRQPRAHGHLRADDAVAAEEVSIRLVHVHRSALTLGAALRLTEQLAQHALNRVAARELLAVIAVRRDQAVVEGRRRLHADDNGLLAVVKVAETLDELGLVQRVARNLHPSHLEHQLVHVQQLRLGHIREVGRHVDVVGDVRDVELDPYAVARRGA